MFLVSRQDFRDDVSDAGFFSDGSCGRFVVTGQHDRLKAHLIEFLNCFFACVFNNVSDADDADETIVLGKVKRCFSAVWTVVKKIC